MKSNEELTGVSAPGLPPSLLPSYHSLSLDNQRLFNRVFQWLWNYLNRKHKYMRFTGVLYYYWIVERCRILTGLSASELVLLSYLYDTTNQGANIIHSDLIYNSSICPDLDNKSLRRRLWDLKHSGYITRHTVNTSAPYLSCSHSRQPVFIKLTLKGVNVIQGIERDMYKILLNSSLNDITGVNNNKKP